MSRNLQIFQIDKIGYIKSINPIEIASKTDKEKLADKIEKRNFRELIGQLSWATVTSRLDMSFSSCQLRTMQSNPKMSDLVLANRTLNDLQRDNAGCLQDS